MSELKQHWNKFQKFLGDLPPKKIGMALLSSDQKVIHGGLSKTNTERANYFSDLGAPIEDLASAYKYFSQKYESKGLTVIRGEEFLDLLSDIIKVKEHGTATESYYCQLQKLRETLALQKSEKPDFVKHLGTETPENFWPREHFFLEIFRSMFADLLPEKKILFLGLVNEDPYLFESLLLEFQGSELKGFAEPDWAGFDWKIQPKDYYNPEFVKNVMQWCENRYVLPTYAVVCSLDVWHKCRELQLTENNKTAWKYFLKMKTIRDVEREVTIVPEPWPLTAALYWNAKRRKT